jgi:hypothetical protein
MPTTKRILFFILIFTAPFLGAVAFGASARQPMICLLDTGKLHQHGRNLEKLFRKELKPCPDCRFEPRSIYEADGRLNEKTFLRELDRAAGRCDLVHLSWNLPAEEKFSKVIEKLNSLARQKIVIAASGESETGAPVPLSKTVMGQVKEAFLIGELDSQKKLPRAAYYGPELLSAWPAPQGFPGSSFSSVLLTTAWAKAMAKHPEITPTEWKSRVRAAKARSVHSFPTVVELLESSQP